MPRTKRKTRDRRLLEQSIEREKGWQQLVGELEVKLLKQCDALGNACKLGEDLIRDVETYRERAAVTARQLVVAGSAFRGLAERYAGFTVVMKQSSLRDANAACDEEVKAFDSTLVETALQVRAEYDRRRYEAAQNGCSRHADDAAAYLCRSSGAEQAQQDVR